MRIVVVALMVGSLGSQPAPSQPSPELLEQARAYAEKGDPVYQYRLGFLLAQSDPAESLVWLRKAADAGYAKAEEAIGFAYQLGRGVPPDAAEAERWFRRAAEKGESLAQWALAEIVCPGNCPEADEDEAIRWYKAVASRPDAPFADLAPGAIAELYWRRAMRYAYGFGDAADPVTAYLWNSAAVLTDPEHHAFSLEGIATRLSQVQRAEAERRVREWAAREGIALAGDEAPLVVLAEAERRDRELRGPAEAGDAEAQYRLARRLQIGDGIAVNDAEAVVWLRRAAEAGHARAAFELGLRYGSGHGVSEDDALAHQWKVRAAEAGLAEAQYQLGMEAQFGFGERDDVAAVGWYRRAAEQGDAKGEYALALSYAKGTGVAQDEAEAVRWYRRAADQDLAHAQLQLGTHYAHGRGVARDPVEAAFWLGLAARQDVEGEEGLRDAVVRELTPEQNAEVGRRIESWLASHRDEDEADGEAAEDTP